MRKYVACKWLEIYYTITAKPSVYFYTLKCANRVVIFYTIISVQSYAAVCKFIKNVYKK